MEASAVYRAPSESLKGLVIDDFFVYAGNLVDFISEQPIE